MFPLHCPLASFSTNELSFSVISLESEELECERCFSKEREGFSELQEQTCVSVGAGELWALRIVADREHGDPIYLHPCPVQS